MSNQPYPYRPAGQTPGYRPRAGYAPSPARARAVAVQQRQRADQRVAAVGTAIAVAAVVGTGVGIYVMQGGSLPSLPSLSTSQSDDGGFSANGQTGVQVGGGSGGVAVSSGS